MAGKLSTVKVRSLTAPGRYGDGDGLYLLVRDADRRSWLLRYMLAGKAREMGLGSAATVTLAEAREAARAARRLLAGGVDPLEARRAAEAAAATADAPMTFRDVADLLIRAKAPGWRNAIHRAQWPGSLALHVHPILGDRPVAKVDTGDVMRVLDPIWRDLPETAGRVRGRIEAVLDFAKARGWRTGDNPARWRGHLANLLPARSKVAKVAHHAALPWREVGSFLGALRAQAGVAAQALELVILTAARTGEVIGARWSEVDLADAVWTIPGERMKAGREHRVPLAEPAVALLRAMLPAGGGEPPPAAFVFPGDRPGKPLSNMAMMMLLRRMKRGDLTVHGFRSTFRDWCSEATSYPDRVAEAALAHTVRDKTEAAYRRGDLLDQRRALMAEWATWCERPAGDAKVVPIRRVAG